MTFFSRLPRPLRLLGERYARLSEKHPHSVASASAGTILFSADVTAQWVSGVERWDTTRTISLTSFGFMYYGGPCKALYLAYDRFIGPGRPLLTMIIDVFVHTPFFLLPSFYFWTGAVKGQELSATYRQFKSEWLEASFGSMLFWAPTMYMGFKHIPQHSRLDLSPSWS
jgi:hypothetical protein